MSNDDTRTLRHVLVEYHGLRPKFQAAADYLQLRLHDIAAALGLYPIISGRAKSVESLALKVGRRRRADPLRDVTDLCGVRAIVHNLDDVALLERAIEAELGVVTESDDTSTRLGIKEFGYLSRHVLLRLAAGLPRGAFDEGRYALIEELLREYDRRGASLRVELQLRTLAQHTWADVYHELGYKSEFELPARWQRDFSRLAALLDEVDRGFQAIRDAMIGSYDSNYGAFLDQARLVELAGQLEVILDVLPRGDPGRLKVLHRLVRTYRAMEGGDEKIHALLQTDRAEIEAFPPALRDVGVAYCQAYPAGSDEFATGQGLLRQATAANPGDVDALCSLAGTLRRQARGAASPDERGALRQEARALYREAHQLDPTNPYPLGNHIAEELLETKNLRVIEYMRGSIQRASDRCRVQVHARINLPWAYFDLGLFHLYLGQPYEGLGYYARGILASSRNWMVRTAFKTLDDFAAHGIAIDGMSWASMVLEMGWWLATPAAARRPAGEVFATVDRGVPAAGPLLIVAGGCANLTAEYASRLGMLREALASFRGTIISGGTRSGIAEVVGDVQASTPSGIQTAGYLPAADFVGADVDTRYGYLRHTSGRDYTPLECLVYWQDLLARGTAPREVRLIGFNGGRISAAEYRIATAFGARVGIVAGSGRAADEFLADPFWREAAAGAPGGSRPLPNVEVLPASVEAMREFLGAPAGGWSPSSSG
jgi:ppGpp synthetase/RelA/SpoT-type nucleotidyltranferase